MRESTTIVNSVNVALNLVCGNGMEYKIYKTGFLSICRSNSNGSYCNSEIECAL